MCQTLLHIVFRPFFHTLIGQIRQVFSFCHFCTFCCRLDSFPAARNPTSTTGAKWHKLFSFQIIGFQKRAQNHWFLAPPNRVLKWSQSLLCVENTGFNTIHKRVLCYFFTIFAHISLHKNKKVLLC